jgi:hypothetical protein
VAGLVRPVLVLPVRAGDWPAHLLRNVLLHELAHVKRRDLLRLLLVELIRALYWFNPLVWRAASRAALEVEKACDDIVLSAGGRAPDYARQLLALATAVDGGATRSRAAPALARTSTLEARLVAILSTPGGHRPAARTAAAIGAGVLLLSFVPLASVQLARSSRTGEAVAAASVTVAVEGDRMASGLALVGGGGGAGVVVPGDARAAAERASTSGAESVDPLAVLHLAAVDGDLAVIRSTVARHPALLDACDARGMTPLALAAWHDRAGIVKYLIDAGADVDHQNANGLTPLFSAIDRGRAGTARILIDAGADLFVTGFRDRNLLHMTARAGDTELARLLVEAGVPLNARDARGARPLTIAVARSHVDMTAFLLGRGAVMNDVEMTRQLREALHDRPSETSISEYLGEADVVTVDIYNPEKHRNYKQHKKVARIRARE